MIMVGLRGRAVVFDATKLDDSKVKFNIDTCPAEDGVALCGFTEEYIPAPGHTAELGVPLARQAGATGSAGKLTITVVVEGDSNKTNDSKTVDVIVGDSGVDLRVIAPDVTGVDADGNVTEKGVEPGAVSYVFGYVYNQGDKIADGVKVSVTLPEQTTFAEQEEGCEYTADNRTVTCDYDQFELIPADADDTENGANSSARFYFPVQVSEDAEGPVTLNGGEFTATALEQAAVPSARARSAKRTSVRPANASELTAAEAALDVDATDNTDAYAVLVAGPAGGNGGSAGGDEEPGLPVTGPVAASVAGAGVVVLALGAFLFIAARRRRIVLVTPGDER